MAAVPVWGKLPGSFAAENIKKGDGPRVVPSSEPVPELKPVLFHWGSNSNKQNL